jgi:hypothetical protein
MRFPVSSPLSWTERCAPVTIARPSGTSRSGSWVRAREAGGQHPLAARWHIDGRKSKGHGSAYEPWDLLDGIKAPANYVLWRGTSYRRSTFPEPSHVRVSMSRRVTAGCSSKTGVPAPNTTGPIIRCSSSTRSFASKSFQSVRLPNTKMSLPS